MDKNNKPKKVWHKRVWVWISIIVLIGIIGSSANGNTQNSTPAADNETNRTIQTPVEKPSIPTEFKSALNKADTYANTMNMSKAGVFDQLTSQHGEKFSQEAAQYAIDNVRADWNTNALEKAKTYQNQMSMSIESIRDQLTSPHGEKFTIEEADYAIQHLE
jgi:hypothetical protein